MEFSGFGTSGSQIIELSVFMIDCFFWVSLSAGSDLHRVFESRI